MDIYAKIAAKVKELSGGNSKPSIFTAQVKQVDGATCSINIGGLVVSDVRLRAVDNSNLDQILITPKIDSYVLVADLSNGNYRNLVVIAHSEVAKAQIAINNTNVEVSADGVVVNGGNFGGMCKTQELKTQLDKLTARLDGVMSALQNSPTLAQDGGATYKAAIVGALNLLTDKESFANIENDKVKH